MKNIDLVLKLSVVAIALSFGVQALNAQKPSKTPTKTGTGKAKPDPKTAPASEKTVNLALGRYASQSSLYDGASQGAVDGVKVGDPGFHTLEEQGAWWQVDLGSVRPLTEIVVFNRMDCCSERARTLEVKLSDDGKTWKTLMANKDMIFGGSDGKPLRVSAKGSAARYVRLQLAGKDFLHLDEVEVYGTPEPRSTRVNLALKHTATQSSVYDGTSDGAVDGVINGKNGFHTLEEQGAWWQVDLGSVRPLTEIVVFNRMDCCSERARTIEVKLSNDGKTWKTVMANKDTVFGGFDGNPLRVAAKGNSARHVRLQLAGNNFLHLDEVEVY